MAENMTCEEYVKAIISNQPNSYNFKAGYPDGLSIQDVELSSLFDIRVNMALGKVQEDGGEFITLIDFFENCQTKYEI